MRAVAIPRLVLITAFIACLAGSAAADESEAAPDEGLRFGGRFDLPQLLRLSEDGGRLAADFTLPEDWSRGPGVRCEIQGSKATWIWRLRPLHRNAAGDNAGGTVQLWYRDAGDPHDDGFTKATIYSRTGYLAISGIVRFGPRQLSITYRGRRDSGNVEVEAYVVEEGEMTQQVFDESASSLRELRRQHQEEVDALLGPLLRKLAQKNLIGPGAADVYQLFASIGPDPAAIGRIQQLLPRLDAPDSATREKATRELDRLGRSGVLAALRCDRHNLSPEQRARLGQFVDAHRRRSIHSTATALHDVPLLIECFQDEDLAVRRCAKSALETALGHPVAFDPAQGFDNREAAIMRLRRLLDAEQQPASADSSPVGPAVGAR